MKSLSVFLFVFILFSCGAKKTGISDNTPIDQKVVQKVNCSEDVRAYLTNNPVVSIVGGYQVESISGPSNQKGNYLYDVRLKANVPINSGSEINNQSFYKTYYVSVWTDENCKVIRTKSSF